MTTIFRFQDLDGRGPFKPGMSKKWIQDYGPPLPPAIQEVLTPEQLKTIWIKEMHHGTGCKSLHQLARWFTQLEQFKMKKLGYFLVSMEVDQILFEDEYQLLFARKLPLNQGVTFL